MLRSLVLRGLLGAGIALGMFAALPGAAVAGPKSIEKRALKKKEKSLKKKDKGLERKLQRDKRQEAGIKKAIKKIGPTKKKKKK